MSKLSCLGGWCRLRDKCSLHTTEDRRHPVERLCEAGQTDAYEPIRITRTAGTWERANVALVAPATWMDGVAA